MTVTAPTHDVETIAVAPAAPRRRGNRIVGNALIAIGIYLIVVPFALSLFTRTSDAEKLAGRYREFGTEEALAAFSEHTAIVADGGEQLLDDAFPRFAAEMGMSDAEFDAFVAERFPNLAVYQTRAPEVFAYLVPAVAQVATQADNIDTADDFPVAGVPVTVGPWGLLAAGIVLVGLGVVARARGGRAVLVVALAAGIGLAAAPLVLEWPDKVDAAEDVAEAARLAFTPAVAAATTADTYMIDAAVIELREAALPAIAVELGLEPDVLNERIALQFPELATFLADWPELSVGAHEISQSQIQYMDEFHNADATPYRALPWLFVIPGLVMTAIAAVGLISLRDRTSRRDSPP